MEGFLLDTNAIGVWFTNRDPVFLAKIASIDQESQIRVSAITLGEIEFGNRLIFDETRNPAIIDEMDRWVNSKLVKPIVLCVSRSTREYYGELRAQIFRMYPTKSPRQNHVEKCVVDKVSGLELGIDENDLWIASQAIEYGLTLVTSDKMERIQRAAHAIGNQWELKVEDWTKNEEDA